MCDPFNISDVGTKVNSTLGIYYRVDETNFYRVGFMSRKECRQVMDPLRPEMAKESSTRGNLHINSRSPNKYIFVFDSDEAQHRLKTSSIDSFSFDM